MRLYLVDPVHDYVGSGGVYFIPLCVLNIAAYVRQEFGDDVEIELFKFPGQVFDAIDRQPPDMIGVSNYIWNHRLGKAILTYAKRASAATVTVMGGPNVMLRSQPMRALLADGIIDYYIPDNVLGGEKPFAGLVSAWLSGERPLHAQVGVHGVSFLDPADGALREIPADIQEKDLDWQPSPFAMGLADRFLDEGLAAMISTNRGCPNQCTFCVWGNASKVVHYGIDRVRADLDYCGAHAKHDLLMITDANFGLFRERDLEIAQHIRHLNDSVRWPLSIVVNWGQVRSEVAIQVADTLKGITLLRQSSQSISEKVLKAIKRRNIPDSQWRHVADECRRAGIESFAELILMLPEETMESYLDGIRYFFELGFSCINTNQCQLLQGAEMNTPEHREKYGVKTAWRLLEGAYGEYRGEAILEAEEVVVETKDFSLEDNFKIRMFNWLVQMSWTLKRHDILIKCLHECGLNPVDLFIDVIVGRALAPEGLRNLMDEFDREAREELFPSYAALRAHYGELGRVESLKEGGFKKLNTYYSGRALDFNDEIIRFYCDVGANLLAAAGKMDDGKAGMIREAADFTRERALCVSDLWDVSAGKMPGKVRRYVYDFVAWDADYERRPLSAFVRAEGCAYAFRVADAQKAAIKGFMDAMPDKSRNFKLKKLCEPYYGIRKEYLNFIVEPWRPDDAVS